MLLISGTSKPSLPVEHIGLGPKAYSELLSFQVVKKRDFKKVDLLQPLVKVLGKVANGATDLAQVRDYLLTIKQPVIELGIVAPAGEVILPEEGTPLELAQPAKDLLLAV